METNDKRRDVATRLRNVSGAPEWATTACCIAECLGEYDYPLWDDSKPLFNRLADLIEPESERTCKGVEGFCNYLECTECGESWDYMPNYCPNCGAKVVYDER